ncbi:hypothetical protein FOZ61_000944 [Perkinsus olseni]|uniref:Uncharacterized protein n=1 Tax=Perkinsus olseni TaxID=32597 RepID=A0A7J6MFF2_PEROL
MSLQYRGTKSGSSEEDNGGHRHHHRRTPSSWKQEQVVGERAEETSEGQTTSDGGSLSVVERLRAEKLKLEKDMLRLEKQNRQLLDENKKLKVQKQVVVHSEEGLRRVLDQDPLVNMSCFGHNNYKNVSDLYFELQHEICWLERDDLATLAAELLEV